MVQRVFTYIWYNLVHATNAWKKDKELNVQACRILKHLWFVGRQEQRRWHRRQEPKHRGMERAPKQGSREPPGVRNLVLERGADEVGEICGKTETEAPVSTRNLRPERESCKKNRVESPAGKA